ncbi:MAG: site-2 protease family protein, partial [Marivirga sp.]|nr:site-2 protease family protein [Marivirga sp.]
NHRIIASIFFVGLLFYSGLGFFASEDVLNSNGDMDNILLWVAGATGFLYLALTGLGLPKRDTIMYALIMVAVLLVLSWLYPALQGYSGWLLFLLIVGKFIGVQHPPSEIEEPLDNKRIILGWISLAVFVVCFSPAPIVLKILIGS